MDPQIPVELIKAIAEQNQNPVRIEKNLVQKNLANNKTKSYIVQLGSSTLILSKTNESPISEAYKKQIVDQLCQIEQQKKMYHQLVTKEPLLGSKDTVNQIRGGNLGKGSSPGARARSDARKAITNRAKGPKAAKSKPAGSGFTAAWVQNLLNSNRARPVAANRLAQQLQPHQAEGGNGLFGRFSTSPNPDPSNPGCSAGPRSLTVRGLTQNVGSEKKDPSSGSLDYKEVMRELERQSSRKKVEIEAGDQIYTIKNPYREDAYELGYKLADTIYDSIRECDTDICDIAKNLGFKANNIKNVKDHVFYNKHDLDRLAPAEPVEYRRFDANIQQALAWKRLETGTHTQDDITWIKHECAERHHELKYGSGYSEAHDHAQSRFDGAPWEDQF